jgi:hypothetical protein
VSGTSPAPRELPEHVQDSGEWKAWPRKVDAHLSYGVRERQITAYVRSGKLVAWACPDSTVRLDPDKLGELFGQPGEFKGRDRDLSSAERQRRRAAPSSPDLLADPVAAMLHEAVAMMRASHGESVGLIKVITDPLNALLQAYKDQNAAQAARIKELEARIDEAEAIRAELADAAHERELRVKREANAERRRDETLQLLKDQVPELVSLYVSGSSLSGWAKKVPRDALEMLIDSDALAESVREELRRAAGIPSKPAGAAASTGGEAQSAPPPPPNPMNGVSAHGHS